MRVSATAHKPCRVRELHGVRMCQWLGTEVESGWIGRRLMGVCVVSMQGAGVSGAPSFVRRNGYCTNTRLQPA